MCWECNHIKLRPEALVLCAHLQEGGVDSAEGRHALGGQPSRKGHGVLLSNAHVEAALGEDLQAGDTSGGKIVKRAEKGPKRRGGAVGAEAREDTTCGKEEADKGTRAELQAGRISSALCLLRFEMACLLEAGHPGAAAHGGMHADDAAVARRLRRQRISKVVGQGHCLSGARGWDEGRKGERRGGGHTRRRRLASG